VAAQDDENRQASRSAYRFNARQWSRIAWAISLLFASLPVASRIFLGVWGFELAAGISFFCLILGTYFYIASRPDFRSIPDSATMMDQAIRLASLGRTDEAIALLTRAIRFSPRLWQAYQYRGQVYLAHQKSADKARQDFTDAIRLAPEEPHLYWLRGQSHSMLGDDSAAQQDYAIAAALTEKEKPAAGGCVPSPDTR
jgi:tetratricopeptide (TPR) repeat protein